jgi:hypothetical protein
MAEEALEAALSEFVRNARGTEGRVAVHPTDDGRTVHVDVSGTERTAKLVVAVKEDRLVAGSFEGLHDKVVTEAAVWQKEQGVSGAEPGEP